MNTTPLWGPFLTLLRSRKFFMALIPALAGTYLFVQGQITAENYANLLTALGIVVAAAIAGEDMASKISKKE